METRLNRYTAPQIDKIELDNEVSLTLESTPPFGPDEMSNLKPEFSNYDFFKTYNS